MSADGISESATVELSQEDANRILLALTEKGNALFEEGDRDAWKEHKELGHRIAREFTDNHDDGEI